MKENILRLLTQVNVLINKNNEILDATGSRFNIFSLLGVNHYENTHSTILAEFLDPKGSHALGGELLKLFLKECGYDGFLDTTQAKVKTELFGGENGRMDIVVESCGKAIIIENKIYAGDQLNQLQRYKTFAEDNGRYQQGYVILYLTLYGDKASDQSCGDDHSIYNSISYNKTIIAWLEQCVMIAANYPIVRETINQYINHIKKLTHQDMNTKQQKEIIDIILSSKANIETALDIASNINYVKESIINKCAKRLISDIGIPDTATTSSQGSIYIYYKGYYMLWGDDGKNIYVSIRTEDIRKGIKNTNPVIKNSIFTNYSVQCWNPFGSSYLGFSFYDNQTLIKLTDFESNEYLLIKDWGVKMMQFIDNLETNQL